MKNDKIPKPKKTKVMKAMDAIAKECIKSAKKGLKGQDDQFRMQNLETRAAHILADLNALDTIRNRITKQANKYVKKLQKRIDKEAA